MARIKSLSIKNSPFYNDIKVIFSQKLNCIMGGRGTGKSTLLYFIKSCLIDGIENEEKIEPILKNNLGFGELNLEMQDNDGNSFHVKKILNEFPVVDFESSPEASRLEDIQTKINCDFYETNKIEFIGRDNNEKLKLIDLKKESIIQDHLDDIKKIQNDLFSNSQTIIHLVNQTNGLDEQLKQFVTAVDEFENHKKIQPDGISDTEKKEFETADKNEKQRDHEDRFFRKNIELLREVQRNSLLSKEQLLDYIKKLDGIDFNQLFFNLDIIRDTDNLTKDAISSIVNHLKAIDNVIEELLSSYNTKSDLLRQAHQKQQTEFTNLKAKYDKRRLYFETYNKLSKKVAKRTDLITTKQELEKKIQQLRNERKEQVKKLNSYKDNIYRIRQDVVNNLNEIFHGDIKVSLNAGGLKEDYTNKLTKLLSQSGRHYIEIVPRIVERFSPDRLAKAINEEDVDQLKTVEGIDEARAGVLLSLKDQQGVFDIESLYCPDLPEFYLRVSDGESVSHYKKSEELSMGQRCTTVLPIVFSVSNNPLIIDQPEDNLDNKYIADRIHEIIKDQKENRQIIFVTHNPNIPVLANSDHNIFLKYDGASDVDTSGNVEEVKSQIIELLEGGEEAFKRRKEIYNL